MYVVEVPVKVPLVFDGVFPISRLPNAMITAKSARFADRLLYSAFSQPALCEFLLDPAPARRIVGVARRKGPDCMQMIWKQDNRGHGKGPIPHAFSKDGSQDGLGDGISKQLRSRMRHESEKISSALHTPATIVGHHSLSSQAECAQPHQANESSVLSARYNDQRWWAQPTLLRTTRRSPSSRNRRAGTGGRRDRGGEIRGRSPGCDRSSPRLPPA